MALRALGRSRVMTARPLGWTLPFTNSSATLAMEERERRELGTLKGGEILDCERGFLQKREKVRWTGRCERGELAF